MSTTTSHAPATTSATRPVRLGFAGLGWIGRQRMQAALASSLAEAAVVVDPCSQARAEAAALAPGARLETDFDALLDEDLDGAVIATPSALHSRQAIAALERGLAVFCQKPLARTAPETRRVVDAARRADRLLGVDFCYRHVRGVEEMRRLVGTGELGRVYAAELTFHNAYGPDKPWFYDAPLSGGGCAIDLGIHLVDLALWMGSFPQVAEISGLRFAGGRPLAAGSEEIEDHAVAQWLTAEGALVRLACSWNLSAGRDAVIEAAFYGTRGAVALRNVNGSFYDFSVEHFQGTASTTLAGPPDDWGGRPIAAWVKQLASSPRFDPQAEQFVTVAEVLDGIYGRCAS